MITRRNLLALSVAIPAGIALKPALAAEPAVLVQDGYGADGGDVVNYFTEGSAREGSEDHVVEHDSTPKPGILEKHFSSPLGLLLVWHRENCLTLINAM